MSIDRVKLEESIDELLDAVDRLRGIEDDDDEDIKYNVEYVIGSAMAILDDLHDIVKE